MPVEESGVQDVTGFHAEGGGASTEEFQQEAKPWCLSGIDLLSGADEAAQLESLGVFSLPGSAS